MAASQRRSRLATPSGTASGSTAGTGLTGAYARLTSTNLLLLKRMPEDSGRFPRPHGGRRAGRLRHGRRAALESARVDRSVVIAGLETLPWACRLVEPGRRADVLGTKSAVDAAITMHPDPDRDILARHTPPALEMMQTVVGPAPTLRLASGFLGVSLMNIISFWHPTLMWHRWKVWDGQETFDAPPML